MTVDLEQQPPQITVRTARLETEFARVLLVVAVVAASIGIAACDRLVDPPLPTDAEQFSPPVVYTTWWNMTQACSRLTGSMGAVTWYKTSEVLRDPHNGALVVGYWVAASNRIVLATDAVLDGRTVRHEMLHALLRVGGHPRSAFLGNCLGTVECAEACVQDAGAYPTPPETPIHIGSDSLELTVQIAPGSPTRSVDDGFFSVTVVARNRSAHWATVLPELFVADSMRTFSYDVQGAMGEITDDQHAIDPAERVFAPGESKRLVFDFRVGDDAFSHQLVPGNYSVRGAFSDFSSNLVPFVVGP